jgi:hypothetical protein
LPPAPSLLVTLGNVYLYHTRFVVLPFSVIHFTGDQLERSDTTLGIVLPLATVLVAKELEDAIAVDLYRTYEEVSERE